MDRATQEAKSILLEQFGIACGLSSYANKVNAIAEAIRNAEKRGYDKCKKEWDDDNYNKMVERGLRD